MAASHSGKLRHSPSRRLRRSTARGPGVCGSPRRSEPVDLATVRREAGRPPGDRASLKRYGTSGVKKNALQPWRKTSWCIAPTESADCVWAMEDMLEDSRRPHDPRRPLSCIDEASTQQVQETQEPFPRQSGHA